MNSENVIWPPVNQVTTEICINEMHNFSGMQ